MSLIAALEELAFGLDDESPEPANDPTPRKHRRPMVRPAQYETWFDDWRCCCPDCLAAHPERAAIKAARAARDAHAESCAAWDYESDGDCLECDQHRAEALKHVSRLNEVFGKR